MIFIPFTDEKSKRPVFVNPLPIQGLREAGFGGTLLVFRYENSEEIESLFVDEEPDAVLEKIRLYTKGS